MIITAKEMLDKLKDVAERPPEEGEGIVAMLDALGASNYDTQSAKNFLEKRKKILEALDKLEPNEAKQIEQPQIFTFGDTIIFAWPVGRLHVAKNLKNVATWLNSAVCSGIREGILFRGSISAGQFIWSEDTILGPAVADAASWYEAADWFGVLLTPMCAFYWEEQGKKLETLISLKCFMKSEIQLKTTRKEMWALSWPGEFLTENNSREALVKYLQQFSVPKGTESKYKTL